MAHVLFLRVAESLQAGGDVDYGLGCVAPAEVSA